ncbi:collagen-like protein [Clavibacter sp.]|uniref:collagen-like protein n=1 Tax=Clavibacter sp. TaxID=1871044 RepID=UPI0019989615|nr:collagen-like protein [Clavibacter sp.]MBD5381954.1 collagen-like protein [Clavibacter sp.]
MAKVNYKSDFDFVLSLTDCNGKEIGLPDYNWVAKLYTTSKDVFFEASYQNGVYKNCFADDGKIHIICNDHGLPSGVLKCEFIADIPNGIYPDDYEKLVIPKPLDIELVRGMATCPHDIDVSLILPYIKGDKGDKGDRGEQGERGEKGDDGADGKSAYEQAVEGGYEGTEEEFIESLAKIDELPENIVLSEETDKELEEIEPNIVANALRKNKQILSDSEKQQVLENLGDPQITQLVDFWKMSTRTFLGGSGAYDSWGDYDKQTGEFVYCGLPFSREQVNTMLAHKFGGAPNNVESAYRDKWWLDAALPLNIRHASSINYAFSACRKIQAVVLYDYYPNIQVTSLNHAFNGCYALVCIKGYPLDLRYVNGQMTDVFKGCRKLQEVWIQGLKSDLSFVDSPLLRMDCLQYMIDNAMNTSLITITFHPDIYAKLTDEQNDEWYNILKLASSKNIQFATI